MQIVPLGDRAATERAVRTDGTAAVIIEPVQGEGGVRPVSPEWLGYLRRLCDDRGVALIVITSYSIHYTKLYDSKNPQL